MIKSTKWQMMYLKIWLTCKFFFSFRLTIVRYTWKSVKSTESEHNFDILDFRPTRSIEHFLCNISNTHFISLYIYIYIYKDKMRIRKVAHTHTHTHTHIYIYVCVVCVCVRVCKLEYNRIINQWSGRPGFNPRSHHTKDFKNGTWYLLA